MIAKEDLSRIHILEQLADDMLDKFIQITEFVEFETGHVVYKEGDLADVFYMLRRGKILIEQRISPKATVTIDTIRPGESFGLASLLDVRVYHLDAICAEPSKLFLIKSEDLLHLFQDDHSLGYKVMRNLTTILEKQLERRTEQFLRTIKTHPDIHDVVQSEPGHA
ncbi:cyclic nucleotide-binding domain-containing protein [candidate division CSSED10-310 bacterium]|uniref:Cyclic nucleotide-binding domain-containing protein n=1 Tax=candidate division CSSED10-310 bacterium TaxID=2855610 RepID=A0ABV6YT59_UNCC1